MKKSKIIPALIAFSIAVLAFNACRKDAETDDTLAFDTGVMESVSNDVDNMVGQVAQGGGVSQRLSAPESQFGFSGCAVVTHDSINHHITLDFGTGCVGLDGRTRAGKIQIDYSGRYMTQGSYHTCTYDSFYVDNRHIEGSRTITNNGMNTAGNMNWTIVATNMKITRPDGLWRNFNSTRNRELIQGFGDSLWTNDVYRINGTATGSNSRGHSFSETLTNLIRDNSCHWITSGTIAIISSTGQSKTIDFGNGNCDDLATVTEGNQTRTITLH